MKQPDHDYNETLFDRDDRPIQPTCAYCGKPKHLCDGGAKQTDNLETPGKLKRSELDALLTRVEQGARAQVTNIDHKRTITKGKRKGEEEVTHASHSINGREYDWFDIVDLREWVGAKHE